MQSRSWLRAAALAHVVAAALAAPALADEVVAIRDDGAVVVFDSATPQTVSSVRSLTGLADGELLVGVDFRPTDGALFGVGSTNRVYRIQRDVGVAVPVSTISFTPILDGTDFGVTFEPDGTLMRITSDTGQNLVLDPTNGQVTSVEPTLRYAVGDPAAGQVAGVVASAWARPAQSGDVLVGIDLARGLLVRIDSPSAGTVVRIGALGVTGLLGNGHSALDVSPDTGTVVAVLDAENDVVSRVYTVNLSTGALTQSGAPMTALMRSAATPPASPPAPPGTRLVGLVAPATVVTFTTDAPGSVVRTVHLRGLPIGESFAALAVRPLTGVLYGLTRSGLYDISLSNGTAELVGAGFGRTLPTSFACDFDPRTGQIRVAAGRTTNLLVDPATGLAAPDDAAFAFAPGDTNESETPTLAGLSFIGRANPGTTSACYALEAGRTALVRVGSPALAPNEARDGRLFTVGPLSPDDQFTLPPVAVLTTTSDRTGYAALQTAPTQSSLFLVGLTSGRATVVGSIGASGVLRAVVPEPTADPPRVSVEKAKAELNFKRPGRDSLVVKGRAPTQLGSVAGKSVTIDVGGLSKTFLLNAKGAGKDGKDTVKLAAVPGAISFKLKWSREALVAALADENMDGTALAVREVRQLVVRITVDNRSYRATLDVLYSANPGKKGKISLQ